MGRATGMKTSIGKKPEVCGSHRVFRVRAVLSRQKAQSLLWLVGDGHGGGGSLPDVSIQA